ncbi:MAG TPA: glycoside hydrolase family 15 protein [Polyangiaceae bacterium]|nr:glycoside hydrolase family 15 protein [Polyangiaceae bacterium]
MTAAATQQQQEDEVTAAAAALHVPPLDHGAIGNGRVLALVSPTSAIEWMCLPRFDSPSVFARLLDERRGGTFRVLYGEREVRGQLRYLPNTNVLSTRFDVDGASWEIVDFAPRIPDGLGVRVPLEVVRIVRPIAGHPKLRVDFDPRPDYARGRVEMRETTHGIEVTGAQAPIHLATNLPCPYVLSRREFVLTKPVYFVLTYGRREWPPTLATAFHELELTVAGWRAWAKTCALPNFAAPQVLRSALCLKLHAYHDTGAIIAASTTSIPEAMGTPRAWDYRYCWLRDAAFVVEALRRLGHLNEGEQFLNFLRDVAESGPLQPLYGIDGERSLREERLTHLSGFGDCGWVRIGNQAADQRQNDLMGELILCLETLLTDPRIVDEDSGRFTPLLQRLVEEAIEAAPTPDTSIWEFRTLRNVYTFSRAMCWVAIDRGASLARRMGRPDLAERWGPIADRERAEVLRRGYSESLGFFTQALDGQYPDASLLLLPTIGIIDARDPRFLSTIDAYEQRLVTRGMMRRYAGLDDFGETHSAFTICSFWWAEALALTGRLERAVEVFERITRHANPVGLFSEDIDPDTGALLGNFPQAYTHVGLIHAAMTIGELLEARDGRARAWT